MSIYTDLYSAQRSAQSIQASPWLAPLKTEYIRQHGVIKQEGLWMQDKAYDVSCVIDSIWSRCNGAASFVADQLDLQNNTLVNTICPINIVNGKRHFFMIPRSVEKCMGSIFTAIEDRGALSTYEIMPGTLDVSISQKVDEVFQRVVRENQAFLNPENEPTGFNYHIRTIQSNSTNAFALPAGAIRIYSQIIKEIAGAIGSKTIKDAEVKFADESIISVDLSGVTLDDVLAALIGHELTHVASRHAAQRPVVKAVVTVLCGLVLSHLLPSQLLIALCAGYAIGEWNTDDLAELLDYLTDKVTELTLLFQSRLCEYEADVTGAYFAKRAGYNPLGALYLSEVMTGFRTSIQNEVDRASEPLRTHPAHINRKRAVFAAIASFASDVIRGKSQILSRSDGHKYDMGRAGPAFKWVSQNQLGIT
ncbi:MAG: M48 family metalloprotease [Chlamydiae bacterium]|nr:M48 family metalloprotease [Chlamydiota bacterium]